MMWNSVRVRLTLWNAVLLVLLLGGLGLVLCYRVQADLRRSVDHDLAQDAERVAGVGYRELAARLTAAHPSPSTPEQLASVAIAYVQFANRTPVGNIVNIGAGFAEAKIGINYRFGQVYQPLSAKY